MKYYLIKETILVDNDYPYSNKFTICTDGDIEEEALLYLIHSKYELLTVVDREFYATEEISEFTGGFYILFQTQLMIDVLIQVYPHDIVEIEKEVYDICQENNIV